MAFNNGYDGQDPSTPDPAAQQPYAGISYNYQGQDPAGKNVYQGSDGNLYTDDAHGVNGFGAYSGPGVAAAKPKGSAPVDPVAPPPPTPTVPTTPGAPPPGPNAAPTQAAAPNAPTYTPPPAFVPPPAFSYGDFQAPTGADVLQDPGYQFELNQGMQAIGAKNAALGTLNTGGTIKDYVGFGQNLASTKYGDIFNRKLSEYGTNRGNALENYNTNFGTQYKDPYAINYASQYADPFAFGMQSAGLQQQGNQFNAQLGAQSNQFNANLDFQKFLQQYKSGVSDPFDQKYKLLSLL